MRQVGVATPPSAFKSPPSPPSDSGQQKRPKSPACQPCRSRRSGCQKTVVNGIKTCKRCIASGSKCTPQVLQPKRKPITLRPGKIIDQLRRAPFPGEIVQSLPSASPSSLRSRLWQAEMSGALAYVLALSAIEQHALPVGSRLGDISVLEAEFLKRNANLTTTGERLGLAEPCILATVSAAPGQPFCEKIVPLMHKHRSVLLAGSTLSVTERGWLEGELGSEIMQYDVSLNAMTGKLSYLTEVELVDQYGWKGDDPEISATYLKNLECQTGFPHEPAFLEKAICDIQFVVLRDVVHLEHSALHTTPLQLLIDFSKHWTLLDCTVSALGTLWTRAENDCKAREEEWPSFLQQLGAPLVLIECLLTRAAENAFIAVTSITQPHPLMVGLLTTSRIRFLKALKRMIHTLPAEHEKGVKFNPSPLHWKARCLSVLDYLPGWVNLAIIASDPARQSGELSSAKLSWEELRRLQRSLREASFFYALSGERYHELSRALEAPGDVRYPLTPPASYTPSLIAANATSSPSTSLSTSETRRTSGEDKSDVARAMVENVVQQIAEQKRS